MEKIKAEKPTALFHKRVLHLLFGWLLLMTVIGLNSCQNTGSSAGTNTESQPEESHYAEAIRRILAEDEELGGIRNHACEDTSLSATIRQYVAAIDALDFNACPADFTTAFQKHRAAWAASVPFFAQFDDLRGEMHDLFTIIEKGDKAQKAAFDEKLKLIQSTWMEVEALARRYDALPKE